MSEGKSRNYNLDLIKILACLAVVGLHSLFNECFPLFVVLYYICGFSVPMFFLVSGYTILNKKELTYGYVFKKILSLCRIILLWSVITAILFNKGNPVAIFREALGAALQSGTLWQMWYLYALIFVYLFAPLLHKSGKNLVWLWLAALIIGAVLQGISYIKGSPVHKAIPQAFRLWCFLQYFMLGGLMGRINIGEKLKKIPLWLHFAVTAFYTVFYALLRMKLFDVNIMAEYFYDDLLCVIWVVLLFTLVMRLPLSKFSEKVVALIAPLTFGIYIIHPVVIAGLDRLFDISVYTLYSQSGISLYCLSLVGISGVLIFVLSNVPFIQKLVEV